MIYWTITASVLILLVLALRGLLKTRLSLRLRYALWALVLVRLLVPVNLGSAPFSLEALTRQAARWVTAETTQAQHEEAEAVSSTAQTLPAQDNAVLAPGAQSAGMGAALPETGTQTAERTEPVQAAETTPEATKRAWTAGELLRLVWLVGAGLVGLWFLGVNLRFYRNLRRSRTQVGFRGRLRVYASGFVPTPCLFGFLRPGIYLPPQVWQGEHRDCVLAHEETHYRHLDHVWGALRCLALALHWYNPLVWLAAALSRRDSELPCDEGTLARLGDARREDYGRALIDLASGASGRTPGVAATTLWSGGKELKERITMLVRKPKTTLGLAILALALCGVAAACTFTGATEQTAEPAAWKEIRSAFQDGDQQALVLLCAGDSVSSFDLDGDGAAEKLQLSFVYSSFPESCRLSLTVNGTDYTEDLYREAMDQMGWGENPHGAWTETTPDSVLYAICDLDPGDRYLELAVMDDGPSNDYTTAFFRYDCGTLTWIGTVEGLIYNDDTRQSDMLLDAAGGLETKMRLGVLQTWWTEVWWRLDEDGRLGMVPQTIYYAKDRDYLNDKPTHTLLKPLLAYPDRDETALPDTLTAGEEITLLGTDNAAWVLARDSAGTEFWIHLDGPVSVETPTGFLYGGEVLGGLNYAD